MLAARRLSLLVSLAAKQFLNFHIFIYMPGELDHDTAVF